VQLGCPHHEVWTKKVWERNRKRRSGSNLLVYHRRDSDDVQFLLPALEERFSDLAQIEPIGEKTLFAPIISGHNVFSAILPVHA
jgi:hypothetical protein